MRELQFGGLLAGTRVVENLAVIGGAGGLSNALYSEFSGLFGGSARVGDNFVVGLSAEYSHISVKDFSPSSMLEVEYRSTACHF